MRAAPIFWWATQSSSNQEIGLCLTPTANRIKSMRRHNRWLSGSHVSKSSMTVTPVANTMSIVKEIHWLGPRFHRLSNNLGCHITTQSHIYGSKMFSYRPQCTWDPLRMKLWIWRFIDLEILSRWYWWHSVTSRCGHLLPELFFRQHAKYLPTH